MFSLSLVKIVVASAFLSSLCTYSTAQDNIVVYWGQDSAGNAYPNNLEKDLSYYCNLGDNYNVINLSFMISFVDARQPSCSCLPNAPDLNFANHGNNCTVPDNCPFLLDCSASIGNDILKCQQLGKKIVLSLGGASGDYGFTSNEEAESFANTIWQMFFVGNNSGICRPFGENVILDGIDLDIEGGSNTGYSTFVTTLRQLMDDDSTKRNKEYIISGAPQCPYPDPYLGDAIEESGASFSWLNVQFYNNYCQLTSSNDFWTSWSQWNDVATKYGFKINVGIPASSQGASSGYVSADEACDYVAQLKSYDAFGGIMLWDASWDMNNGFYSNSIRQCLGQ